MVVSGIRVGLTKSRRVIPPREDVLHAVEEHGFSGVGLDEVLDGSDDSHGLSSETPDGHPDPVGGNSGVYNDTYHPALPFSWMKPLGDFAVY